MSDNDLIRRGEVRELLQQCGLMGNHPNDPLTVMFNAIPAVQPTVSPDVAALVEAVNILMDREAGEIDRQLAMKGARAALAHVKEVV